MAWLRLLNCCKTLWLPYVRRWLRMLTSVSSRKSKRLTSSSWSSRLSCAILSWTPRIWRNSSQWWSKSTTRKRQRLWRTSKCLHTHLPMVLSTWILVWLNSVRTILKVICRSNWRPIRWLPKWIRSILLRTGTVSRNWFHRATFRTRKLSCACSLCIRIPKNAKLRSRICLPYSRNWPRQFFPNCVVHVWRWTMKSSVVAMSRSWHNSAAMLLSWV